MFRLGFTFVCVFLSLSASINAKKHGAAREPLSGAGKAACATTCEASSCNTFTIKYGRYCGITHTGCPGTEPCDAYDSCCAAHDACVVGGGVSSSDLLCHSTFKACLSDALAAGEQPWSDTCSASQIVQTMSNGMDLASAFAGMLKKKTHGGKDL